MARLAARRRQLQHGSDHGAARLRDAVRAQIPLESHEDVLPERTVDRVARGDARRVGVLFVE